MKRNIFYSTMFKCGAFSYIGFVWKKKMALKSRAVLDLHCYLNILEKWKGAVRHWVLAPSNIAFIKRNDFAGRESKIHKFKIVKTVSTMTVMEVDWLENIKV